VSRLHLIDCENENAILAAPRDADYVVLSYVWGADSSLEFPEENGLPKRLPEEVPQTIRDAIEVTKKLGLRYLWVDKYCINQHDRHVKSQQIHQMELIYRNAELCIVAADGVDENHGLPGISLPRLAVMKNPVLRPGRHRRTSATQPALLLRNAVGGRIHTKSDVFDVQDLIRASHWATRAWTYQEGLLSRRCLVFTAEQMYFECAEGTFVCESAPQSGSGLSLDRKFAIPTGALFGICKKLSHTTVDGIIVSILGHIAEYSQRTLRNEQHVLNAMGGIFKHYQSLLPGIFHLSGLPFLVPAKTDPWPYLANDKDISSFVKAALSYSLTWAHVDMGWEEDRRPESRPEFPSWSWSGWVGAVDYSWDGGVKFVNYKGFADNFVVEIRGMTAPFQRLFLCNSYKAMTIFERRNFVPRVLYLDSIVVPSSLVGDLKYLRQTFLWTVCGFNANMYYSARADAPHEVTKLLQDGHLSLVLLGGDGNCSNGSKEHTLMLVLGQKEKRAAEFVRCGIMSVECRLDVFLERLEEHGVNCYRKTTFRVV
jgi:hypothetical protein